MKVMVSIILIWILIFPSRFAIAAPFILFCLLLTIIKKRWGHGIRFNFLILLFFSLFLFLGCGLILRNVFLFNDVTPWTYWIAGYLFWFLMIVLLRNQSNVALIVDDAILFTAYFVAVFNLLFVLSFISGVIGSNISTYLFTAYYGRDPRGFIAYSTTFIPVIGFLVPYFSVKAAKCHRGLRLSEKVVTVLLVIAGLLSLRIFIFVSFVLSLMYYFIFTQKDRCKILFTIGVVFLLAIVFLVKHPEIAEGIYHLKLEKKVSLEDPRVNQLKFWLDSFADAPFVGHGLSSVHIVVHNMVTGEIVNERPGPIESPYGYEILYGKMLSDSGLIFICYVLLFGYLTFFAQVDLKNKCQVSALRFGALNMILQSATNSYLGTSGWLFVLMLPAVFISPLPNVKTNNGKISTKYA